MTKQKTHKGIQRFVCICSMFIMAFLFALTPSKETKAKSKSSGYCTLQSVTIEVNGKKYVCDGSLNYIPVEYNADWKEFVKTIKITDYQVLVNDGCSHVDGHDSVEAGLYEETGDCEFNYTKFLTYEDGKNSYTDMEDSLDKSYYEVMFCLDGDNKTSIVANFKEECKIIYDLDGGSFPEGLDVPTVCGVGETIQLVSPVKSGCQFEEWMINKSDDYFSCDAEFRWNESDPPPSFKANWNYESTPVDIGDAEISWDKEVPIHEGGVSTNVDVKINGEELTEGIDYYLSYKNNDKLAAADSDNPPTVTITGIGKYTGTVEKTFSIVENDLLVCKGENIGNCTLRIVKGKPLSSIDLSDIYVVTSSNYQKVKGTFSWENEEYVPEGDVGDCLYNNDPNNDEKPYNLIFTPDNQEVYCQTTFSYGVDIFVYKGSIADCSVTFAPDQNYQYTGDAIKPEVIVKDGETALEEGTDYEVYYSGYINPARSTDKYAPTVTVKGKGYYYTGSQKLTYTIEKEKGTPYIAKAPTASAITYGEALGASTLSGGVVQNSESDTTSVNGTFTWKEAATKPTVADSSKTEYVVVFKPKDKDNYNDVETKLTLTVNKAKAAPNKPGSTMNTVYTNDTVGKVTLPKGWVWKDSDKTKALEVGKAVTATAIYNGADKSNYVTESVEITITRLACTHTWDVGVVTKEATPTEKGVKIYTCTVCKETKTEEVPALGAPAAGTNDTSDDGTATYKVTASDLTKGTVAYVAPTNKDITTVSIPETVTIDGITYKVTSIADNAFANNKKLTKVTIDSNVKTIGKKAFYKCTKLKTVKTGNNVTSIGSNAFYGCSKLTSVTIGSNVTTISDKAFYKCTSLGKITIPSKVKKIGKQTFYGCKKLKSITIKTTKLTSKNVGSKAFKGIYSKATIKVPKSKLTSYKKILKAKGCGSKVTIRK